MNFWPELEITYAKDSKRLLNDALPRRCAERHAKIMNVFFIRVLSTTVHRSNQHIVSGRIVSFGEVCFSIKMFGLCIINI